MKRLLCLPALCAGLLLCAPSAAEDKKEGKGEVVELDGLKSTAPAEWKAEPPSNQFRQAQFRLPPVKGDKQDTEIVIFKGLGGSAKENVKRWQAQFIAPEGKSLEDVSKVSELKIGGSEATALEISGTFLYKARPVIPDDKAEKRANYRMTAIQFEGPKTIYHIKFYGPAASVEHYKKGFDEWIKAFK